MSDIYTRADGLIDIVKFLDDEIDISKISKNISFKDIIRKDKKFELMKEMGVRIIPFSYN